jgi:hypothetical protein
LEIIASLSLSPTKIGKEEKGGIEYNESGKEYLLFI